MSLSDVRVIMTIMCVLVVELLCKTLMGRIPPLECVDVSYAALQVHRIINVALHREYSPGILFIFSQGKNDLYHV
jgi:hypothetical protein